MPAASLYAGLTAHDGTAAEPYLAFLTELAVEVGVTDPVETYLRPLVGNWDDLSAEAGQLRHAADIAAEVSAQVDGKLGKLDAGWSGGHADAFVTYMREIGAAGGDVREALDVLAAALDELVHTLRQLVGRLVDVLVDAAEVTSESASLPVGGTSRARTQLQETHESAKSFYEAARDVLLDFRRLCDGVDGPDPVSRSVEINHRYPSARFEFDGVKSTTRSGGVSSDSNLDGTTTASAAPESASPRQTGARDPEPEQHQAPPPQPETPAQPSQGGTAMSVMPMMAMGGMGGGGGDRRKSQPRQTTKPDDLFGTPDRAVPPVIGPEKSR